MNKRLVVAAVMLMGWPSMAPAYIDGGGGQITLPEILSEFRTVTLLEVEKVELARGGFRFKMVRPLKGVPDRRDLKLQIDWGEAGPPFKDLQPGRLAIHFTQASDRKAVPSTSTAEFENLIAQRACLTFLDGTWLHTMPGVDGWQSGTVRRDFEIASIGTSAGMADAVAKLLRGHEVLARCRRLKNAAEIHWVRYSLDAPNSKTLARDPAAPAAAGRPTSAWTAELRDKSAFVRLQAALALAELGPAAREAGGELALALRDADPEVRAAAVQALGAIVPEGQAVVEGLARALTDDDWFVRLQAAQALRNFGPKGAAAAPALAHALKPNDFVKDFRPVRCGAAMAALSRIDPSAKELEAACRMVVDKLLENERQGSFGARATGARLLGDCGAAALPAVPALVKLMHHPEADARVAAAEALLKIAPEKHAESALGALVDALKHADLLIRVRAARALGRCGVRSAGAVTALRALLQDPEPEVRTAAQEALRAR